MQRGAAAQGSWVFTCRRYAKFSANDDHTSAIILGVLARSSPSTTSGSFPLRCFLFRFSVAGEFDFDLDDKGSLSVSGAVSPSVMSATASKLAGWRASLPAPPPLWTLPVELVAGSVGTAAAAGVPNKIVSGSTFIS